MVVPAAHEHVLIVDDDAVSLRVTALMFESRGWRVDTAVDLDSALALAMRNQPNVIVSELLLPGVQSFQFARSLRGAVENDVHIVGLTRAASDMYEQARRDGFDGVFAKPLDFADLERHVRATTRMRRIDIR